MRRTIPDVLAMLVPIEGDRSVHINEEIETIASGIEDSEPSHMAASVATSDRQPNLADPDAVPCRPAGVSMDGNPEVDRGGQVRTGWSR